MLVSGYERVVKRLLEKGGDVNSETDDVDTPLNFASAGGIFANENVFELY